MNPDLTKSLLLVLLSASLLFGCKNKSTNDLQQQDRRQVIRIATASDPQTLDPRLARDLTTATALHLLYEGLTRQDSHGKAIPALAEAIEISEDLKTYTFTLRESMWSNGDHVTAHDFERSWKSVLDPHFPAPNANQLFVIKGAEAAKAGTAPIEAVKIHAQDPKTLIVELETPTPYFLELLATQFFYPVNRTFLQKPSPDSPMPDRDIITNGPFKLEKWDRRNEFTVVKNSRYWDEEHVYLSTASLILVDEGTALKLFETGQLEWAGSPLSTIATDALPELKEQGHLEIRPAAGTHWLRFNTGSGMLANAKFRSALSLAIDRHGLVEHVLQGSQKPATGIVPPPLWGNATRYFEDNDMPKAWSLFQEALNELNISKDDLQPLTICYASNERTNKIAQTIQQQWSKAFGIKVVLEPCESHMYFTRLKNVDFQVSIGSWYADFADPINFLEIFRSKNNGVNNTHWENEDYSALLAYSGKIADRSKRIQVLKEAEKILIQDMPIAPLFHASLNYVKKNTVNGVYLSELGWLDLKNAYINVNPLEEPDTIE
jgi:oligopeptide transport system substrate-binding protein